MVFGWYEWFLDGLNVFWVVFDGLMMGDREYVCVCVCGPLHSGSAGGWLGRAAGSQGVAQ